MYNIYLCMMHTRATKSILFSCICLALTTCTPAEEKPEIIPEKEKKMFYGMLRYSATLKTDDSTLAASLRTFSPDHVDVYFDAQHFRMIEHGGLSHGNILLDREKQQAWQLDTIHKLAYIGEYSDLGDPSPALKELMPDHFAPTVEATGKKEIIGGLSCSQFLVLRSGVIPKGDTAYIWAADERIFPSCRFDFQTEINQVAVPPPLFIGHETGAVLRLEVISKRYTRIFEVTELKENYFPEGIFEIPDGYQKK